MANVCKKVILINLHPKSIFIEFDWKILRRNIQGETSQVLLKDSVDGGMYLLREELDDDHKIHFAQSNISFTY